MCDKKMFESTHFQLVCQYFQALCNWLCYHKEWLFSGIGVLFLTFFFSWLKKLFNRKRRKLQIKTKFALSFEQIVSTDGLVLRTGAIIPAFSFEITNIGEVDVQIKNISWDLCRKQINYNGLSKTTGLAQIDPMNPKKYQKKLNPGDFIKGDFNIGWFAINEDLRTQLKPRNKIRLEVQDTLGNRFYSQKYKYKEFLENVRLALETNKKVK